MVYTTPTVGITANVTCAMACITPTRVDSAGAPDTWQAGDMPKPAYGYQHRRIRARLLPKAWGQPCAMCGYVMHKWDTTLQLDHSTPVALGGAVGDRIVHGGCNSRAGVALREQMKHTRGSQDW